MDSLDSNSILKNVLIILVVVGIAYLIYTLYLSKSSSNSSNNNQIESYKDMEHDKKKNNKNESPSQMHHLDNIMKNMKNMGGVEKFSNNDQDMEQHMEQNQIDQNNAGSYPKAQLTAQELLPANEASTWSEVNPSGVGSLKDRNFLQAGYNIGINTVGQTLRNANLQLRSEPPCPQIQVSPWSQSSIESDTSRKPFEIGGCM